MFLVLLRGTGACVLHILSPFFHPLSFLPSLLPPPSVSYPLLLVFRTYLQCKIFIFLITVIHAFFGFESSTFMTGSAHLKSFLQAVRISACVSVHNIECSPLEGKGEVMFIFVSLETLRGRTGSRHLNLFFHDVMTGVVKQEAWEGGESLLVLVSE